jgi:hypothetical protein
LGVRRHDRDGSRVFVASVELPGAVGRVGHRDAIEETWGRPKVDEVFAVGEPRIFERESDKRPALAAGRNCASLRKEA